MSTIRDLAISFLPLAGSAVTAGALGYFYALRIENLPPNKALARAIDIGFEVWQKGSYAAPRVLMQSGKPSPAALQEAGAVLKGEIIGNSSVRGLPPEIARPHPELAGVDPVDLATGVRRRIAEEFPFPADAGPVTEGSDYGYSPNPSDAFGG